MTTKKAHKLRIPIMVPVQRYLKKYVQYQYNLTDEEALLINNRGSIPLILGSLLYGKSNLQYWERNGHEYVDEHFDDLLKVEIDTWRSKRGHVVLTLEAVKTFDRFLFYQFHDFLLSQIRIQKKEYGIKEMDTINNLIHRLGIEDDIGFDALKKTSYRIRKEREIKAFSCRNNLCA